MSNLCSLKGSIHEITAIVGRDWFHVIFFPLKKKTAKDRRLIEVEIFQLKIKTLKDKYSLADAEILKCSCHYSTLIYLPFATKTI